MARALKEFVRSQAEDRPGVYRWLAADGRTLYVGKSIRVKTRLLSYFREEQNKAARMVREASDVTWEYMPNEFSALLREMKLIRTWRPDYNVQHKRKRRYAFVKVTNEPAPRIQAVTRVAPDGGSYYGPFGRVGWVTETVMDLARTSRLRDCPGDTPIHFDDQLEMFSGGRTPACMRAETGSCLAPCAAGCSSAEYAERVRTVRRFLEGRSTEPIEALDVAMQEAATRLDFEHAALLMHRRERLEKLRSHLASFRGKTGALSFVYRVPGFKGNDRIYLIREGRVASDHPRPRSRSDLARLREEVRDTFAGPVGGPHALDSDTAAEVLLVTTWFKRKPKELNRTVEPEDWLARGTRHSAAKPD